VYGPWRVRLLNRSLIQSRETGPPDLKFPTQARSALAQVPWPIGFSRQL
jgi:hypothetical protein